MRQQIVGALKTKYINLGFSEKAFDGVATFLEKTVTEETQIEEAIGGVEPLLKAFQGDIDRVRTELSIKAKELEKIKESFAGNNTQKEGVTETTNPPKPSGQKDDLLEKILAKVEAMENKAQYDVMVKNATAILKEKGVPASFYNRMLSGAVFDSENTINTVTESIANDFEAFRKDMIEEGLLKVDKPIMGVGKPDDVSSAMREFLKARKSGSDNPLGAKSL